MTLEHAQVHAQDKKELSKRRKEVRDAESELDWLNFNTACQS